MSKVTAIEIAGNLINKLWVSWLKRLSYAREYTALVDRRGGKIVIDHMAFRTINAHTGEQPGGIMAISHIFDCLGYHKAGKYTFPQKKLNAVHLEHPEESLPKIFISQLEVDDLPEWAQRSIKVEVRDTPYLLSDAGIELLCRLQQDGVLTIEAAGILGNDLFRYFRRAWDPPLKETVLKLNDISQYAAWVLLHGNSVSHFSALVNDQDVPEWPDLEATCKALEQAGVSMKEGIKGDKGGRLQQAASLVVKEDVEVKGDDGLDFITWTYSYFQLTQRGYVEKDGEWKLFNGFLEDQSRNWFSMTRTRDN